MGSAYMRRMSRHWMHHPAQRPTRNCCDISAGLPIQSPPRILRVRDIVQRNAAEDMLLARSIASGYPDMNLMAWQPFVFPGIGAEWYLRVRDFLYRFSR